jgi:hypothetical protein
MMNKMFGFPTGACANAGKFVAGKLSAARATLDTSRLPIFRLIFMIPDPPLQVLVRLFCQSHRSSEVGELPVAFASRIAAPRSGTSKSEQSLLFNMLASSSELSTS